MFNIRKLNLAPRFGISYDLFGNGKTAVRGGYGMYYDRTAPYELYAKANPPFNAVATLHSVSVDTPGQSGGAPVNSTVGLFGFTPKQPLPYSQQWSLGFQQEVRRNTVATVDYIGTKGTHLMYEFHGEPEHTKPGSSPGRGQRGFSAALPRLREHSDGDSRSLLELPRAAGISEGTVRQPTHVECRLHLLEGDDECIG